MAAIQPNSTFVITYDRPSYYRLHVIIQGSVNLNIKRIYIGVRGGLEVSMLDCQSRGSGSKFRPGQKFNIFKVKC